MPLDLDGVAFSAELAGAHNLDPARILPRLEAAANLALCRSWAAEAPPLPPRLRASLTEFGRRAADFLRRLLGARRLTFLTDALCGPRAS